MSYFGSPIRSGQRSHGTLIGGGGSFTADVTVTAVTDVEKCLVTVIRVQGSAAAQTLICGARMKNTTTVEINWNTVNATDFEVYFQVLEFK